MRISLLYGKNVFATGIRRYAFSIQAALQALGHEATFEDLERREWKIAGRPVGGFASLWLARLRDKRRAPVPDVRHALDAATTTRRTDVVTVHDLIVQESNAYYTPTVAERMDWALNRRLSSRAGRIVAISDVTREQITRLWGVNAENVSVARYGLDHSVFRPTPGGAKWIADGKPTLVFVGDDNPRKNITLAVRALRVLRDEHGIDARFVRIGPWKWPNVHEEYQAYARKHHLDLVEPGPLIDADRDLAALYSACSAFVWPTLAEGFGMPPLEAMACGAPVVAHDIPISREILGEHAVYHENDPSAMARAVVQALQSRPPQERALRHARQYTWARCAEETVTAYEHAMKR